MGDKERILIAENNSVVLDGLKRNLQLRGQNVVATARSRQEGSQIIADPKMDFTFAILDARVPCGGDGQALAREIVEKRPGVKIMSFTSDTQDWPKGTIHTTKDWSINELVEAIIRA